MTGFNSICDQIILLITWGDLPEPVNAMVSNPEPGGLEFNWEPISSDTSHVLLLAYASGADLDGDLCGARRKEGKHTLHCENTIGKEADIFISDLSMRRGTAVQIVCIWGECW